MIDHNDHPSGADVGFSPPDLGPSGLDYVTNRDATPEANLPPTTKHVTPEAREAQPLLPTNSEELVTTLLAGINSDRDAILAHYQRSQQNPYLSELAIRSVVAEELDRISGDNLDERRDTIQALLRGIFEGIAPDDPNLAGVVIDNLLDAGRDGQTSITRELDLTNLLHMTDRAITSSQHLGIPQLFMHDTYRRIEAQPDQTVAELTEILHSTEAAPALSMMNALEHTGARAAENTENSDEVFNAIGTIFQNLETHSSPLVSLKAQDTRANLQFEYLVWVYQIDGDTSEDSLSEIVPGPVRDVLAQNAQAYDEFDRHRVIFRANNDNSNHPASALDVRVARDAVGHFNAARQLSGITPSEFVESDERILARQKPDSTTLEVGSGLDELLTSLHEPTMRRHVEQSLNVSLANVSLEAQVHLLKFMAGANHQTFDRLRDVMHDQPELGAPFLESFTLLSEDVAHADTLLGLAEALQGQPEASRALFGAYEHLAERARHEASELRERLDGQYPGSGITEQDVAVALMSRGRDLLVGTKQRLGQTSDTSARSQIIQEAVAKIHNLPLEHIVIEQQFQVMAGLLGGNEIDLRAYTAAQRLSSEGYEAVKPQVMRTLAEQSRLKPVPEVHWRVDRTPDEYSTRLGLDVPGFLKTRAAQIPDRTQIMLEFGPGSGKMLQAASRETWATGYQEVGMADTAYYSLEQVVAEIIDFEALEGQIGQPLNSEERSQLAHFAYCCLVIAPGETAKDQFDYDPAAMEALKQDINGLKRLLPGLAERISKASMVPQGISTRDAQGGVIYPYKLDPSTMNRAALQQLGENFQGFVKSNTQDQDLWEVVDAFPANVMMGSFTEITRLAPNQIDVAVASRSTVYLRDQEYVDFVANLRARLVPGGVVIDDSVRDNDGWKYRLSELQAARTAIGEAGAHDEWLIIMGSPFEGEDLDGGQPRQGLIPRAFVLSRAHTSLEAVKAHLQPGSTILTLDQAAEQMQL